MSHEPTLLELLAAETDPRIRKVLERYRGAEIELEAAAHQLEKMGRYKWSLAVAQRAREVAWQAQRYMRAERGDRVVKLYDFINDEPTNPNGYPPHTGLSEQLEPEWMSSHEAVLDTERAPPLSLLMRRQRLVTWGLNIGLFVMVIVTIWLLREYNLKVD